MFEQYRLGLEVIDDDHKTMVETLVKIGLVDATRSDVLYAMDQLYTFWIQHVQHELLFMRAVKFPFIDHHVAQHVYISNELKQIANKLVTEKKLSAHYIQNIVALITNLLVHHLSNYDMQFRPYVDVYNDAGKEFK